MSRPHALNARIPVKGKQQKNGSIYDLKSQRGQVTEKRQMLNLEAETLRTDSKRQGDGSLRLRPPLKKLRSVTRISAVGRNGAANWPRPWGCHPKGASRFACDIPKSEKYLLSIYSYYRTKNKTSASVASILYTY